jgi:hypothetical protein
MAIRFTHKGRQFAVDTPDEAAQLVALLNQQDAAQAKRHAWNRANYELGAQSMTESIEEYYGTPWTPDTFILFLERLGDMQKTALALLIEKRTVTDVELRDALKVSGNQALAGILSGISKQAAALDIPAREIFSFENMRSAGKRSSTYNVAEKFARIAKDMNWPVPA